MKLSGKKRLIELEVFGALIFVATLNILIFASLSQNRGGGWETFMQSLQDALMIYGTFFVVTLFIILIDKKDLLKYVFYGLLTIITGRIYISLYSLVSDKSINTNGQAILSDAFLIWIASIMVFGMWYWLVDRGGPIARNTESNETRYDLLFPQYQAHIPGWDHWHPKFWDYVFFSFFTSTGFSPADTLPLTKRIKTLMMLEASLSLVIIGMVASRAISLLQ
ncbi:MAG: hypothetical protein KBD46_00640 [Candidatus Levybacteria bacterium]|nr:hypothetical protein [Candidatus Levybacteria bacterium]